MNDSINLVNMNTTAHRVAFDKMGEIMSGKQVISNSQEMDLMLEIDDTFFYDVVSVPNPNRLGLLDQYLVYVKTVSMA